MDHEGNIVTHMHSHTHTHPIKKKKKKMTPIISDLYVF